MGGGGPGRGGILVVVLEWVSELVARSGTGAICQPGKQGTLTLLVPWPGQTGRAVEGPRSYWEYCRGRRSCRG